MHIQFLYYADCPSHDIALERLRGVMHEERIGADVDIVQVETEEQAQQLRFPGSPTILINGQDIAPLAAEPVYALTCRAYQLEDGRISPLPSIGMLRAALHAATQSLSSRGETDGTS